jgi:uncharacterized protein
VESAAEQGHIEAQYNLGVCYYYGHGIDNDIKEAIRWLQKASERGYEAANSALETLVVNASYTYEIFL